MNRLRLAFALLGFAFAVFSVALDDIRLGWAAIALLLVSAIARLILRKRANRNSETGG